MYPAARVWIIRYAIADLIFSSVRFVFYVLLIQPKIVASMQSIMTLQAGGPNPMLNMAPMMNVFMYIGDAFSLLLLSWPIAVLYVMSRAHVKAVFGVQPAAQM